MTNAFTVGACIKTGWEIFKKRPRAFIGIQVGLFALGFAMQFVQSMILGPNPGASFLSFAASFAVMLVVNVFVYVGVLNFYIKAHDSAESATLGDLWNPSRVLGYLGGVILYMLAVFAGCILLIIPGIIASVAFILTPYLIVDKSMGPVEAMKESARLTKGYRWRILIFTMAMPLIILLGFLALFVGSFVSYSVMFLAGVDMYKRLLGAAETGATPQPLTKGEKTIVGAFIALVVVYILIIIMVISLLAIELKTHSHPDLHPGQVGFYIDRDSQPADSLAPLNAVRVPFTTFTITNHTSQTVTIPGITVKATTLPDMKGIAEVELVDDAGVQIGTAQAFDANREATIGGAITIPANGSQTYTVAANIASCEHACADDGLGVEIAVTSLNLSENVTGEFPVVGAHQTMNSPLVIGSVKGEVMTNPPKVSDSKDTTFTAMRFTVGTKEDVNLYSMKLKYTGNVPMSELSDVKIRVSDRDYPTTWSDDGQFITATFMGGVAAKAKDSIEVSVHGTVNPPSTDAKTVTFEVADSSDVYFVGQTFGYGIQPEFAKK